MMITPSKRRSYQDHRQFYRNVQPKVQTRWPNGIPLIRNGRNKIKRRNTESCLQMSALLSPETFIRGTQIEEELESNIDQDEGYTAASSSLSECSDPNISASMDISMHLDVVSGHFKHLYSQLDSLKEKASVAEKNFIEMQVREFKEQARQIDYMINELINKGERLEKFVLNRRHSNDWTEWK